jgi:hypothetical protein
MRLNTNDRISWSSAAGVMTGVITNIELNLNAAQKIVPWIDIKSFTDEGRTFSTRLCATQGNLVMMQVNKISIS